MLHLQVETAFKGPPAIGNWPPIALGVDGHLLLYTLSHIEPSGNAPVRPGYNELTLQLATAACHVQRPNRNYLT
jgi:hypothetical protein